MIKHISIFKLIFLILQIIVMKKFNFQINKNNYKHKDY